MRGIHRRPVNSPHKGPVTRKMFPFDDVIMFICCWHSSPHDNSWCHGISLDFVGHFEWRHLHEKCCTILSKATEITKKRLVSVEVWIQGPTAILCTYCIRQTVCVKFPSQKGPVIQKFYVAFMLVCLCNLLNKQLSCRWFEMPILSCVIRFSRIHVELWLSNDVWCRYNYMLL